MPYQIQPDAAGCGGAATPAAGLSALEQGWIARQIIPSDTDESELLKHCAFWNMISKQAAPAQGKAGNLNGG